jgi:error-prone DNA polymerase
LVVQWDKEALDDVGLVKLDVLGLRMLSAIAEAVEIIEETTGKRPDLDALAFDDPAVYDLIARADTVGVFQVESRAQATILPRLRPKRFEDLIISISLIRPGPIQGNMVHPYLRRRLGEEPVTYDHPLLEPALAETLGVILFQEQVLKVGKDLGGLTPGQGEQLRRALGAKHAGEAIERLHDAFTAGAREKGVSEEVAEAIFDRLRAFGGYSFAKSHAAAFAVLVYQSAWLKVCHPTAFFCALLNHQPMGFWSPAVLTGDARRHGVRTLPVDVNRSHARCAVESEHIRLGFEYVDKVGEVSAAHIEATRGAKPYVDLADFCCRTRLPRRLVENLVMVGAMDVWGSPRRKLLWELGKISYHEEELDLVFPADDVALPPLTDVEKVRLEYSLLGLSTSDHVMALYRPWLEERGVLSSGELKASKTGEKVKVAGMVMVHQAPPTAKGVHFITLEDEEGLIDVVVRPDVHARYRQVFRGTRLLVAEGIVQRKDSVVNLLALGAASF